MSEPRVTIVLVAGAVLGFAVGCSGGGAKADAYGERSATRIAGDSAVVELRNLQFAPQGIRIKAGTRVTWVNRDAALHNVSQIQSTFLSPDDLKEGDTFSFTFDVVGTYRYQCTLHHPNMNGVVIVEE